MTTTVTKGTNRPAAAARTAKHAQRTALPPRSKESVELAREAVAETKPAKGKRQPVVAAAEPEVVSLSEAKSHKATRNAAHFKAHGWAVEVKEEGELSELIATRGSEVFHLVWINGVYDYVNAGTYAMGDQVRKPRQLAEARRWAERSATEASKVFAKVNSNKQFRRRPVSIVQNVEKMPFALDAPEEEIVAALAGKQLSWTNIYRVEEESATLPKASRFTEIRKAPDGSRVLLFLDHSTGFRALRLSALTKIGRTRVGYAEATEQAA